MRKTFALLITLALAASCAEQEVLAPVEPTMPGSGVLIVPGLSIGTSMGGEAASGYSSVAAMTGGSGTTRAATYPYVIANAAGKRSIIVTKDADGKMENMTFHERWEQTPAHEQRTTDPRTDVSPRFEVAQEDAFSAVEIWSNENDRCKAPWRRPTQDELVLIRKWDAQLDITHLQNTVYWSSTKEYSYLNRVGVRASFTFAGWAPNDNGCKWLTRCVRDDIYPYVTTNADGKASVIVSHDEYGTSGAALHSPWAQSPYNVHTDPLNSVSYRFEVAQEDDYTASEAWTSENGRCAAPWRRPTEKELKLMIAMKEFLDITPLAYVKANTYWSSTTDASNTNYCIGISENGTIGTWRKSESSAKSSTRCVRDLYDNFPNAAGSNVATLWGYTSTNALGSENLVSPTIIKNTAAGFELATLRYYPADGAKKLYFYAHAPHDGGTITTGDGATVEYNNLDGQKDVMWAKDVRGIAKNTNPAQQEQPFFLFQHKLMQLKFKVVADASFEANQTVTNITVKSVSTSVKMTVKDGATTFSGSGNIFINPTTGNTITTGGTTLAEAMMIAPGSTVTLSVTVGGITFPDITLTGLSAQAGVSHLITLTFKRNAIVPTASMVDWATGGSADIGVI